MSVWWALRAVTGFCFAVIYMVIESWLNERSTIETRGTVFSIYTIINLTVITLGQMMVTLAGASACLASVEPGAFPDGPKVGRYRVNVAGVDQVAVPAILQAWEAGALIVIDEIGPMEIFSHRFCRAVNAILESGAQVLGTIVARPYRFADEVKQHPNVTVVEVTLENRGELASSQMVG